MTGAGGKARIFAEALETLRPVRCDLRHSENIISPAEIDALSGIGHTVLGPLLAGFSSWLLHNFRKAPPSKVFFMSRDGYHLMRAFKIACERDRQNVEVKYLYASRRSVAMASFEATEEGLERLLRRVMPKQGTITIGRYCEFLGISRPDSEEVAHFELPGEDENLKAQRFFENEDQITRRIKSFLFSRLSEIKRRAASERAAYLKYLSSVGALDQERLYVVDCGWFGSTVTELHKIMCDVGKDVSINAFFIGAHPPKVESSAISMRGYLFNDGLGFDSKRQVVEVARLIELFLKTDQPPFYFVEELLDGSLRRLHGVMPNEDKGVAVIQHAAFQFLDGWLDGAERAKAELHAANILSAVKKLVGRPTVLQAAALGWRHYSSDALSNEDNSYFAVPTLTLWQMIANPDLRRRELGASGSKQIYRALCGSVAKRFMVDITSVGDQPATKLHAAVRFVRRHLRRCSEAETVSGRVRTRS